jgi:hypothetical protein
MLFGQPHRLGLMQLCRAAATHSQADHAQQLGVADPVERRVSRRLRDRRAPGEPAGVDADQLAARLVVAQRQKAAHHDGVPVLGQPVEHLPGSSTYFSVRPNAS